MKYYRFYKMQQYVNGVPTETYSKGSLVDMTEYDDYATCMDNASTSTRWVTIGTVCSGTDLYENQQEEITYDGVNWSATGNTRIGSLIESGSSQCSSSVQDWRVVPGEGICQGHDLYTKEAEYINNVPTGNVRAGTLIKVNSADCGSITQWVNVPGEYVCLDSCGRHDKYAKQKEQESYDGGTTWTDTGNVRIGNLIEVNSADCSCSTTVKRWVVVENDFICQGNSKFTKEKEQVSYDNGSTWEDTGNVRTGSLIEAESSDCSDVQYRWVDVSGQYTCENGSKYTTQKKQSSTDGGTTWIDTGATRTGTLVEEFSADCGSVTRWVTVPDEYICEDTAKYYKEMQQYSIDGGVVWNDTQNFRKGTLIEEVSEDCTLYRWIVVSNKYLCTGSNKYSVEKQQVSYDHGETWEDTGETRTFTLIETDSVDCKLITKAVVGTIGGRPSYFTETEPITGNGDTVLRREDFYNSVDTTCLWTVPICIVNEGITEIDDNGLGFMGTDNVEVHLPHSLVRIGNQAIAYSSMTSFIIPENVTSIGDSNFSNFGKLRAIICQPETPPSLGSNVFTYSSSSSELNSGNCPIYVPAASVALYKASPDWADYVGRICEFRWVENGETVCDEGNEYMVEVIQLSIDGVDTEVYGETNRKGRLVGQSTSHCLNDVKGTVILTNGKIKNIPNQGGFSVTNSELSSIAETYTYTYRNTTYRYDKNFKVSLNKNVKILERLRAEYNTFITSVKVDDGVYRLNGFGTTDRSKCLTEFNFPDELTYISNNDSPSYSYNVKSLKIPEKVAFISDGSFNDFNPDSITMMSSNPPALGHNASGVTAVFDNANNCPIYVPYDAVETYKSTWPWTKYASRIFAKGYDRWISAGTTLCDGGIKYSVEKHQSSSDGVNFIDTGETRLGSALETPSSDCGGQIIKATFVLDGGEVRTIPWNSDSELTSVEVTEALNYENPIYSATVHNVVTKIGYGAFTGRLSSVDLPESLTYISDSAFTNTNLTAITIPENVTYIGDAAFYRSSSLAEVTFKSLTPPKLVGSPFNGSYVTKFYVPGNVMNKYKYVYSSWTSKIQPANIEYRWIEVQDTMCDDGNKYRVEKRELSYDGVVWTWTGENRTGTLVERFCDECMYKAKLTLTSGEVIMVPTDSSTEFTTSRTDIAEAVVYPTVDELGLSAFSGNTQMVSVSLPDTIKEIGQYSFHNCGLISLVIPDTKHDITLATQSVDGVGGNLYISDSVRRMRDGNGGPYTSVRLSNRINSYAASQSRIGYNCDVVEIPDSVGTLGEDTFQYTNAKTVILGRNVTSLPRYCFRYARSLESLYLKSYQVVSKTNYTFEYASDNFIIYVPAELVDTYKSSSDWSSYASRIQAIPE